MHRVLSMLLAALILACPLVCGAGTGECAHAQGDIPGPSHHHSEGIADNCVCEGAIRTDDAATLDVQLHAHILPLVCWQVTPKLDAEPPGLVDAHSRNERAFHWLMDRCQRLRC